MWLVANIQRPPFPSPADQPPCCAPLIPTRLSRPKKNGTEQSASPATKAFRISLPNGWLAGWRYSSGEEPRRQALENGAPQKCPGGPNISLHSAAKHQEGTVTATLRRNPPPRPCVNGQVSHGAMLWLGRYCSFQPIQLQTSHGYPNDLSPRACSQQRITSRTHRVCDL